MFSSAFLNNRKFSLQQINEDIVGEQLGDRILGRSIKINLQKVPKKNDDSLDKELDIKEDGKDGIRSCPKPNSGLNENKMEFLLKKRDKSKDKRAKINCEFCGAQLEMSKYLNHKVSYHSSNLNSEEASKVFGKQLEKLKAQYMIVLNCKEKIDQIGLPQGNVQLNHEVNYFNRIYMPNLP